MMAEVTGEKPVLWGESMIGFGMFHFKYASGRQGDWPLIAFVARKDRLTVYLMDGFEHRAALLRQLGRHSKGKSCLHIKRLDDVDTTALRELSKPRSRRCNGSSREVVLGPPAVERRRGGEVEPSVLGMRVGARRGTRACTSRDGRRDASSPGGQERDDRPELLDRCVPHRGRRPIGIGLERCGDGDARVVGRPPRVEWSNGKCSAEADDVGGGDGDRDRRIRGTHARLRARPAASSGSDSTRMARDHRAPAASTARRRADDACRGFHVEAGDFAEQPGGDTLALHL